MCFFFFPGRHLENMLRNHTRTRMCTHTLIITRTTSKHTLIPTHTHSHNSRSFFHSSMQLCTLSITHAHPHTPRHSHQHTHASFAPCRYITLFFFPQTLTKQKMHRVIFFTKMEMNAKFSGKTGSNSEM